jgi:hypothetical protein
LLASDRFIGSSPLNDATDVAPESRNAARLRAEGRHWKKRTGGCYLAMRYVRSPAAFFEDSIFSPPLLPRMLTMPRTVCFCQPVAATISVTVAPLARFIIAITSAFLLLLSSAPFCALARLGALAGAFAFSLAGATSLGYGPVFGNRLWTAAQIRATALCDP